MEDGMLVLRRRKSRPVLGYDAAMAFALLFVACTTSITEFSEQRGDGGALRKDVAPKKDQGMGGRREFALQAFLREAEHAVGLPDLEQGHRIDVRVLCSTKVFVHVAEKDGAVEGRAWRTSFFSAVKRPDDCESGRGVFVEDSSLGPVVLCPIPLERDSLRELLFKLRGSGLLDLVELQGGHYRGPHLVVHWGDASGKSKLFMLMGGKEHQRVRRRVLGALSDYRLCWNP